MSYPHKTLNCFSNFPKFDTHKILYFRSCPNKSTCWGFFRFYRRVASFFSYHCAIAQLQVGRLTPHSLEPKKGQGFLSIASLAYFIIYKVGVLFWGKMYCGVKGSIYHVMFHILISIGSSYRNLRGYR